MLNIEQISVKSCSLYLWLYCNVANVTIVLRFIQKIDFKIIDLGFYKDVQCANNQALTG